MGDPEFIEDGWLRPRSGSGQKGFGQGDSGDLQEGESGSSLCVVSGRCNPLGEEPGCHDLLYEEDSGARKRKGNSRQDAGEAGDETPGDRLDLDE